MKQVRKSVLLWYTPREMYDLVTAVEQYPQFLPWCERAEVLARDADGMTASLHLSYLGVRQNFTTRNAHRPAESVRVTLVDGPFSLLEGDWRFLGLGHEGRACKVEFDLRYAFAGGALERVLSPVFDRIADTFVESFVARAEQVHGKR